MNREINPPEEIGLFADDVMAALRNWKHGISRINHKTKGIRKKHQKAAELLYEQIRKSTKIKITAEVARYSSVKAQEITPHEMHFAAKTAVPPFDNLWVEWSQTQAFTAAMLWGQHKDNDKRSWEMWKQIRKLQKESPDRFLHLRKDQKKILSTEIPSNTGCLITKQPDGTFTFLLISKTGKSLDHGDDELDGESNGRSYTYNDLHDFKIAETANKNGGIKQPLKRMEIVVLPVHIRFDPFHPIVSDIESDLSKAMIFELLGPRWQCSNLSERGEEILHEKERSLSALLASLTIENAKKGMKLDHKKTSEDTIYHWHHPDDKRSWLQNFLRYGPSDALKIRALSAISSKLTLEPSIGDAFFTMLVDHENMPPPWEGISSPSNHTSDQLGITALSRPDGEFEKCGACLLQWQYYAKKMAGSVRWYRNCLRFLLVAFKALNYDWLSSGELIERGGVRKRFNTAIPYNSYYKLAVSVPKPGGSVLEPLKFNIDECIGVRQHQVRGHWHLYHTKTGVVRRWIEPFFRGDPQLGTITKDYVLTKNKDIK